MCSTLEHGTNCFVCVCVCACVHVCVCVYVCVCVCACMCLAPTTAQTSKKLENLAKDLPSLPGVLIAYANAQVLAAMLSLWLTYLIMSLHDTTRAPEEFRTISWWHQLWQTLERATRHSRLIHHCWGRPSKTNIAPAHKIERLTTELLKHVRPDSKYHQLKKLDGHLVNGVLVKSVIRHYVFCQSTTGT